MTLPNQEHSNVPTAVRPGCAVRGLAAPHAMCSAVIMGGFCGSDKPCQHKVLPKPVPVRQSQTEANVFWADKDYKKWVVDFTTGGRRNRRTAQALVGAATSAGARRAGVAAMEEQGKTWVRSAMASVRLATAQDLGCVATGAAAQPAGRSA